MSARASSKSFFGWAFGISLSILFISLWGRAVVVDTETLGESLAPLTRSEQVVDLLTDWMGAEMVDAGVDPALVDPTIDYFLQSSSIGSTLDLFASEVVDAAASPDPAGSTIEMSSLVAPAIPEVASGLAGLGYPVDSNQVKDVVEGLDPLVIREPGTPAMVGENSPTAARLGTATLLAAIGMAVFGAAYIALSEDRIAALRGLATRVAVGGLSFGVLLRLGSWILDPDGGRAPIPETISTLAGSKWFVPFQVGLVAAAVALLIYVGRRLFTPGGGSPSEVGPATPPQGQQSSLSGLR